MLAGHAAASRRGAPTLRRALDAEGLRVMRVEK
jgi:hypothetical protein